MPRNTKKGFTLIELLIVMTILGLLAAIGISNFGTARIKARDAKRKSDLATIAKSLEAYVNDHRSYPISSGGQIICQPPGGICDWGDSFTDGTSVYSATLPEEDLIDRYYYYESTDGSSFTLYTTLENDRDPAIDATITTECGTGVDCNYKLTSSNIQ